MSEEEKKAIEKTLIETINSYEEYYKGTETILPQISEEYKNAKILLNLIDRLQKEVEEKTTILMAGAEKVKALEKENNELRDTNKKLYEMGKQNAIQEILNENWVSKDKIKDKIKDIDRELEILDRQQDDTIIYSPRDICKAKKMCLEDLLKEN